MSAMAVPGPYNRFFSFYQATIGKKAVMAVTGVVLFGFVIGHMLGNLQIYLGAEVLNHYSLTLRSTPALLWGIRLLLLVSVVLHIVASIQLTRIQNDARPVGYVKKDNPHSTYASRTMMWSGPIIAAFVIYHLMHFTFGNVHPQFTDDVYANVVHGFRQIPVSIAYIVAMLLLGMHLYHGAWSMFQSLGMSHPRYTPLLKRFAAIMATLIVAGNISIPVAVMTGLVGANL